MRYFSLSLNTTWLQNLGCVPRHLCAETAAKSFQARIYPPPSLQISTTLSQRYITIKTHSMTMLDISNAFDDIFGILFPKFIQYNVKDDNRRRCSTALKIAETILRPTESFCKIQKRPCMMHSRFYKIAIYFMITELNH
jgi:hypothetical protein